MSHNQQLNRNDVIEHRTLYLCEKWNKVGVVYI